MLDDGAGFGSLLFGWKAGFEMTVAPYHEEFERVAAGFHDEPDMSYSLNAEAYVSHRWLEIEKDAIFKRTWQWVCHEEQLREPGAYVTVEIADQPICIVRDREGELRAFYNVCKHRAHELLKGAGTTSKIMCPYHAWTYDLTGRLRRAPETENLPNFDVREICLD